LLADGIVTGRLYEVFVAPVAALRGFALADLRMLIGGITDIGAKWESVEKAIVNCAPIVATLDPRPSQSALRAARRPFLGDGLVPLFTWLGMTGLQRFCGFLEAPQDALEFAGAPPPDAPERWQPPVGGRALLERVEQRVFQEVEWVARSRRGSSAHAQ
jgi:hypothetical protein